MLAAPHWITRRRFLSLKNDYILGTSVLLAASISCLFGIGGAYGSSVIAAFLFYSLVTLGWCLLAGHAGMFSLAPSTTVMVSAYVSAILSNAGVPMMVAILLGVVAGALVGLIVAVVTSRLKGHYFALATLVAAEIVRLIVTNEYQLTGGEAGLRTGPLFSGALGMDMSWIFIVALFAILTALLFALRDTPGIVIQAIRDDEEIAAIRGVNVPLFKTLIVVLGSSIMGLAGAVYVHYIQLATPQMGSLFQTTFVLAIGIIGGIRSMSGPIVGAAIIIALQEVLRDYPFIHMGLTALSILLVCQFAPTGVSGFILATIDRLRSHSSLKERST
jgi:branched-chain amino acid transport system permease protein